MKWYATIKTDIGSTRLYIEDGKTFCIVYSDGHMSTGYGSPEQFIIRAKRRAAQLGKKIKIERN